LLWLPLWYLQTFLLSLKNDLSQENIWYLVYRDKGFRAKSIITILLRLCIMNHTKNWKWT
jgi:hypothetical protein